MIYNVCFELETLEKKKKWGDDDHYDSKIIMLGLWCVAASRIFKEKRAKPIGGTGFFKSISILIT